jgi:pimeloyl-ACP methyl ester carboxylesterase
MKRYQFALSVLGNISPRIAARTFIRFFSTPPRRAFRDHHLTLRKAAVETDTPLTTYAFSKEPINVKTYTWGQGDKKIILLHGWGGSALDFGQLVQTLVEHGYQVISFDQPAHGFSEGKSSNLVQWMHIIASFLQIEKSVYAIIGHSFGGLAATLTLAREKIHLSRLVIMASSISTPDIFNQAYDQFDLHPKVRNAVPGLIQDSLREDIHDLDINKQFDAVNVDRMLFVYDENDAVISPAVSENFLSQHPEIERFKINGDGHYRIIRDPQVLEKIVVFLQG